MLKVAEEQENWRISGVSRTNRTCKDTMANLTYL